MNLTIDSSAELPKVNRAPGIWPDYPAGKWFY